MPMNNNIFKQQFYNEQSFFFPSSRDNWLDIQEYFPIEFTPHTEELEIQRPVRKSSDPFGPDPDFLPFVPNPSIVEPEPIIEPEEESSTLVQKQKNQKLAPSIITKNVCFNICQKTIKVIQKNFYDQKLKQLCLKYGVEKDSFIRQIVNEKKNFTGPKALQLYIDQESAVSQTFRQFMRWFLKQKYLRHCLTGDMDNKEAYIKYKNEVILVILG